MTPLQFVHFYIKHGSIKAVARNQNIAYRQARKLYLRAVDAGLMDQQPVGAKTRAQNKRPEPIFTGQALAPKTMSFPVPEKGVATYICTSAQNNTKLHQQLWHNLLTLAKHIDAKVLVARYTYMKSGLGELGDKAKFTGAKTETLYGANTLAWASEIGRYLLDERAELAPGLVWCGEWQ